LSYILFLIYATLCCWLLTRIRFVKNADLGTKVIIGLFLLKLAAGFVNVLIMQRTSYLADTWLFHNEGLKEYHLLFSDPKEYFLKFFRSSYASGYAGFFQSTQSYWNDLRNNLMIKLLSIFDIFSLGNYYVNVIFYNFIIFFGNVGLFRVFVHIYKNKKWQLIIGCFLLPSLLYFSSNIHKDGLLLASIGIIVFNLYYALNYSGFTIRRIIYIILSLFFIFILRNYILIAIVPAMLAWVIVHVKKYPALLTFLIIYFISVFVFFNLGRVSSRLNLPEKVIQRQEDFLTLSETSKVSTYIKVNSLNPHFKSFAVNSPQALNHALLRPYFTDIFLAKFLLPFSAEVFLYEILFLLFIFFQIKNKKRLNLNEPFILFGVFFSMAVFLMTGYTIPVIGAIIRYRSIYLPFILVPVLCNVDWSFGKKLPN
jgi:hypothetical protein